MTPEHIESVMDDHLFTMDEELPKSGVWVTKILGKPEVSQTLATAFSAQLAEKDREIEKLTALLQQASQQVEDKQKMLKEIYETVWLLHQGGLSPFNEKFMSRIELSAKPTNHSDQGGN